MPEADDDDVVGDNEALDLGEAAFVGEAAGGAAGDGLVDDRDGEVLGEVLAPAVVWAVCAGHGAVAGQVDGGWLGLARGVLRRGGVASRRHEEREEGGW